MTPANTGATAPEDGSPSSGDARVKAYQRLWFALARSNWSSLVLVPVDRDGSTVQLARSLAEVGTQLSSLPITAITSGAMDYQTALALADLPQLGTGKGVPRTSHPATLAVDVAPLTGDGIAGEAEVQKSADGGDPPMLSPKARIIISIPPVVSEPLGLATTQNADAVVLSVVMRRTRLADARRCVELIGRERIAGCFLVT